jgi:hypothetical protein
MTRPLIDRRVPLQQRAAAFSWNEDTPARRAHSTEFRAPMSIADLAVRDRARTMKGKDIGNA